MSVNSIIDAKIRGATSSWIIRFYLLAHVLAAPLVAQTPSPVQVKSAYVYNFLKYVTWQEERSGSIS